MGEIGKGIEIWHWTAKDKRDFFAYDTWVMKGSGVRSALVTIFPLSFDSLHLKRFAIITYSSIVLEICFGNSYRVAEHTFSPLRFVLFFHGSSLEFYAQLGDPYPTLTL